MPPQSDYVASANRTRNGANGGASRGVVGETVNPPGDEQEVPEPDMTGQLGNLGADLIQLGELQLELLAVDARDATRKAYVPAFLAFFGTGFLIGSCPLALLGLSWWLTEVTTLSLWATSLIIAAVGLVLAGGLFFFAYKGFKRSFALLNRSRAELHSNLEWIKRLISQKHQRRRRWPV